MARTPLINKKLNCKYHEFNEDVLFNQIIKTTINKLLRINDLDNGLKKKLKKFKPYYSEINDIELNKQVFKRLKWNRNNRYYGLAINICELIFLYQLPDDSESGKIIFKDFIQNHKNELANLFENFVFNFYKKELGNEITVHRPKIKWNIDNEFNNKGLDYLPNMRSDIVLENNSKQLIIDTKFYKNILSEFYEKKSFNSNNLYQILNYVNNSEFNGEISGILLYASIGNDMDYQIKINNKIIYIKTLDLNQSWELIDNSLREIANILLINE